MRRRKLQIIVPLLAIVAAGSAAAQITSNPIPAPIGKRGLAVEIVELARLPDTRGIRPADQHVEEINIVRNGGNYGWMKREGHWENGRWRGGALNELYPLPEEIVDGRHKDGITYPVVIYDHDEGRGVTGGFAYRGRITALRGKYVFGDINNGRVFAADLAAMKKAENGIPGTVAPVEEVQLYERDAGGNRVNVSLQELIDRKMESKIIRADLFISQTREGELLITSRQDGTIRMLVPDAAASETTPGKR